MPRSNAERHRRCCRRKKRFTIREDAVKAASHLGLLVATYKCLACGLYHNGKPTTRDSTK